MKTVTIMKIYITTTKTVCDNNETVTITKTMCGSNGQSDARVLFYSERTIDVTSWNGSVHTL